MNVYDQFTDAVRSREMVHAFELAAYLGNDPAVVEFLLDEASPACLDDLADVCYCLRPASRSVTDVHFSWAGLRLGETTVEAVVEVVREYLAEEVEARTLDWEVDQREAGAHPDVVEAARTFFSPFGLTADQRRAIEGETLGLRLLKSLSELDDYGLFGGGGRGARAVWAWLPEVKKRLLTVLVFGARGDQ